MERSYEGTSGVEESFMHHDRAPAGGSGRSVVSREEAERDRDRLISKGRHVLDLCIEQNKVLCVQGFIDSQIERGGVYLDVVLQMREWIERQLAEAQGRTRQRTLRDLHDYVLESLRACGEIVEAESEEGSRTGD